MYDGDGSLKSRFEYAAGRLPVAGEFDGAKYYFAYDQVGSLRAVIDESGTVVKTIRYDSFGTIIEDTNPDLTVPFGFAGGLHDRDTGLVRFGYRDYDPDTGRWTVKDPIGFNGGDFNVYGYVLNNPLCYVDIYGLVNWGRVGRGAVAAGFGAAGVIAGTGATAITAGLAAPAAIAGATTFGVGLAEIIAGFLDEGQVPDLPDAELPYLACRIASGGDEDAYNDYAFGLDMYGIGADALTGDAIGAAMGIQSASGRKNGAAKNSGSTSPRTPGSGWGR